MDRPQQPRIPLQPRLDLPIVIRRHQRRLELRPPRMQRRRIQPPRQNRKINVVLIQQLPPQQPQIRTPRPTIRQLRIRPVKPTSRELRIRQIPLRNPTKIRNVLLPHRRKIRNQRRKLRPLMHIRINNMELPLSLHHRNPNSHLSHKPSPHQETRRHQHNPTNHPEPKTTHQKPAPQRPVRMTGGPREPINASTLAEEESGQPKTLARRESQPTKV